MSGSFAAGAVLAVATLTFAAAATAKDFEPGDLRVCNAERCISITDRPALRAFGAFLYGAGRPRIARPVAAGAPSFALRFRSGYLAAIAASSRLDRVLINGLNCGRFRRGTWYRVPRRVALELRRLTAALEPVRFKRTSVPRSC